MGEGLRISHAMCVGTSLPSVFRGLKTEGERFELSVPFGTRALQARALDHYANPPIISTIQENQRPSNALTRSSTGGCVLKILVRNPTEPLARRPKGFAMKRCAVA